MRRHPNQEGKIMKCVFCHTILDPAAQVGRNDTCPHCNKNLHCCKQCKSYDPNAFNQCREVSASRIVDKERSNLCEHFVLRGSPEALGRMDKAKQAKKALEALFKKK
jgi:hypothetical protein